MRPGQGIVDHSPQPHNHIQTPKQTTEDRVGRLDSSLPTKQPETTLNNGYLGSRIDEERSEMRYVV